MAFFLPQRWNRQPTYPVSQTALANDIGLLHAFNCNTGPILNVVGRSGPLTVTLGSALQFNRAHEGAVGIHTPNIVDGGDTDAEGFTIDLTMPSSMTIAAHAVRHGTIVGDGIAFLFNSRAGGEGDFIGLDLGNRFEGGGSKNKPTVVGTGSGTAAGLWLNGVHQASTLADNELAAFEEVFIVCTWTATAGTASDILAKIDSPSSGYCFPTTLFSFAVFDGVLPDDVCQALSKDYYGMVFAQRTAKIYSFPTAPAGNLGMGLLQSLLLTRPRPVQSI